MGKQQVLTYNGYDMFEVVSALQKSIRRCKEEDALYWGIELYISGFIPYAWKRLRIIATEDVGIANPYAIMIVDELKRLHDDLSERPDKKNQQRQPYVMAIIFLSRCKKSRLVDWALNYWFDEVMMGGRSRQVPDYAIDMHTRRGKIMKKGIDDFFNEGSKLENYQPTDIEEWYKNQCHKNWNDPEWNERCTKAHEDWERRYNAPKAPSRPDKPMDITPNLEFDIPDFGEEKKDSLF